MLEQENRTKTTAVEATTELWAFFRGELKTLETDLQGPRVSTDRATTLHVQDLRQQIARALDPTFQAAAAARSTTDFDEGSIFDVTSPSDLCWVDYVVLPKKR